MIAEWLHLIGQYKMNTVGPSTEPWGTPLDTSVYSEGSPLITTFYVTGDLGSIIVHYKIFQVFQVSELIFYEVHCQMPCEHPEIGHLLAHQESRPVINLFNNCQPLLGLITY